MLLYSFLLTVVLVVGAPYWLLRMALSERYREGLTGRLGVVPPEFTIRVEAMRVERRGNGGTRPLMWIHAVSVGEVLAAARLIDEFKNGEFQRVRPGMVYAVSTTTLAGQRLAEERLPGCAVFYFPFDFSFAIRPYLDLLSPEMVVLIESELWPRLISDCFKRKIPVVVANARVSDRSFPRYRRLKMFWRPVLAKVSLFLAQSTESAERLRRMGAPRVELTGNLKYDARPPRETPIVELVKTNTPGDSPVIVCGSTLEGEEKIILDAWAVVLKTVPKAVLLIAPRHTPRFDLVAALIYKRDLRVVRASTYGRTPVAIKPGSVFLLDTIGDLAAMYGLAAAAFVGGSLVDGGGHNPLEPAQFAVSVLMGPSVENFREIVDAMQEKDGIRIVTPEALASTFVELLQNREEAHALGARGRAVSAAQAGAAARTATALLKLLPPRPGAPGARR
jgi:3-deoxy-D-manno-octulosonic-acid transferase